MKTYPGRDHAFDVTDPKDAWQRTLEFLDRYLSAP
jgi:dienelactone hydrolase